MKNSEESQGHYDSLFKTTCWTDLGKLQGLDQLDGRDIYERLTSRYWIPVYVFLCRKGYNHEESLDLTQGFFHEIVLERRLFLRAEASKGRFRTYLLTTLQHYVAEQFRKANAKKRVPTGGLTSLTFSDAMETLCAESEATPDQVFQHAWAATLLDRALNETKQEYCTDEKAEHWHVFYERIVAPILDGGDVPALADLGRRYGIPTEKKVSNMIVTAKRRFQAILKRILSETMESNSSVEEELADLIRVLSRGSAA